MRSSPGRKSALHLLAFANVVTLAPPAWAQEAMCQVALGYSPAATSAMTPSPVPGLGMMGIGILAMAVGVVTWRRSRTSSRQGQRLLLAALLASGTVLVGQGTGSLVQSARAAGPYELSDPYGGSLTLNDIPIADPAPLITVTNTSGVRLRISSNSNSMESGTCTEGSELAPGAACTTQAICPPPQPIRIQVTGDPEVACDTTTALYTVEWQSSDGSEGSAYSVYAPIISRQPIFDPDSPAPQVDLSYSERPHLTLDANGYAQNLTAATAYSAMVIATAPEGRGFGDSAEPTTSWSFSFEGDSQDISAASGLCYSSSRYGSL